VRQSVNSRDFFRLARPRARAALLLVLSVFMAGSRRAYAQAEREPPLLFGGQPSPKREPLPLDPLLPTGSPVASPISRPRGDHGVCSFRRPVCVHPGRGTSSQAALRTLTALEQAYERLVLALGLPAPLGDRGAGGSDALDVYLVPEAPAVLDVGWDIVPDEFDRAAAFCRIGQVDGALMDRAATQCVGEAITLRLDPGETPQLRRAFATHLWWTTGRPTSLDLEAIQNVQANPGRAIAARDLSGFSEGAALLFEWLDVTRGQAGPAALTTGLLALGANHTPSNAWLWNNEPDLFDVIRHTLGDQRAKTAELMGSFAVARAFLGDHDDGTHLGSLEWAGGFASVRFDWSIDFSSLPRRVASAPIDPTGSMYIWLALDDVPLGATLSFQSDWEHPVSFKWVIVRVDRDGQELGRIDVPYQESGTSAEQRVIGLENAAGLLIIGTNLGGVGVSYPFDPDIAPFEPNRCTVYLAKLGA